MGEEKGRRGHAFTALSHSRPMGSVLGEAAGSNNNTKKTDIKCAQAVRLPAGERRRHGPAYWSSVSNR